MLYFYFYSYCLAYVATAALLLLQQLLLLLRLNLRNTSLYWHCLLYRRPHLRYVVLHRLWHIADIFFAFEVIFRLDIATAKINFLHTPAVNSCTIIVHTSRWRVREILVTITSTLKALRNLYDISTKHIYDSQVLATKLCVELLVYTGVLGRLSDGCHHLFG